MSAWLSAAAFALASAQLGAGLTGLWLAGRTAALPPAAPPFAGRVLILRPCAGDEPGLTERLIATADARLRAPWALRLCLASAQDAAFPAASAAVSALRARGLDAGVVLAPPRAPNRKCCQLAAGVEPGFDAILCADSNVDLAGADLDALLAPLAHGASASWAPPVERGAALTAGDRASQALLGGSLHSFPLLAGLDPAGMVGKLFAVRPEALAAIGGFDALSRFLGEDMELARRLLAAGGRVVAAPLVAPTAASGRSLGEVLARTSRWLQVIRAQRPALLLSYPALFFCTLPAIGLAAAGAAVAPLLSLAALCLALGGRLVIALGAACLSGRPSGLAGAVLDALLADALLAAAWVDVLLRRRFAWRGVPLRFGPGGELRADA